MTRLVIQTPGAGGVQQLRAHFSPTGETFTVVRSGDESWDHACKGLCTRFQSRGTSQYDARLSKQCKCFAPRESDRFVQKPLWELKMDDDVASFVVP